MNPTHLILFDVDATLITTSRSGIAAMGDAGRELFGPDFTTDKTEFAGRLDTLIIRDLLTDNAQDPTPHHQEATRQGYRRHLQRRLAQPDLARPLPGVADLLDALHLADHAALGVLTGNFPETGRIKLTAAGIDPNRFHLHVWATDSPHDPPARDHLPAVGLDRFQERFGRPVHPDHVTIIGDTPHDIACARAHACRSIGVATGPYSRDQLHAAGAHLALDSLADTRHILQWLSRDARVHTTGAQE